MSSNHNNKQPNALIHEKSPYLLQHAYNPVNWMPWSDSSFAKAAAEDKPIFLSIGYSTCHWCHVMERESFEDDEVAALLNENYIAIKVDREERPDVDHIYMTVCQELTGQGGWPLTIIMTPDKKPFYAGTYFPKRQKYGRPGMMELLTQLSTFWREDREKVLESSEKIAEAVQPHFLSHKKGDVTEEILVNASKQFQQQFDERNGGFGDAPKFPTPHNGVFLLREWKRTGDPKLKEMVEATLHAMHAGGIYDHLGFGFARYSVDEKWLVPHFEKMLYDNALLATLYIETYQATGNPFYQRVTREIFDYVKRVMTSPEGGFYSAEDADSEGEEGKFYVWSVDEVQQILGEELSPLFCEAYDVTSRGNFEGHNILNLIQRDLNAVAKKHGLSASELSSRLALAREKLFQVREERIHPHKDDKILTSWNGLMIAALAKGAAAFQDTYLLELAQRAAAMIEEKLVNEKGRLLARYRDGEANFYGYLDDYAFYIWGLQELYMASGDLAFLGRAEKRIEDAISLFWDCENDGFYFYGSDSETLLARPKEVYDGAIPSGNSVMAYTLIRQHRFTGHQKIGEYADKQLQAFSAHLNHYPAGHSFFLLALQLAFGASQELVIAEGDDVEAFSRLVQQTQQAYLPFAVYLLKGRDQSDSFARIAPAHAEKGAVDGQSALYVCENFACQRPLTNVDEALQKLRH